MGAIIDLPTTAGGWTLEMRSTSFYLGVAAWNDHKFNDEPVPAEGLCARKDTQVELRGAFRLPVEEVEHVLAVFDEVLANPGYQPGEPEQPWQVELSDDAQQVEVGGPVVTYGVETDWESCGMVELSYAGLDDLRNQLAQFAQSNPR